MYRLPTEAEWEYACRAGTSTPYYSGNTLAIEQANFASHSQQPGNKNLPTSVGMYPANSFGLFDMHGNVSEWVEDCYAPNYALAPIDGAAVQADDCRRRVYRGGGFADQVGPLRSAARRAAAPGQRMQGVGFRVVRTLG